MFKEPKQIQAIITFLDMTGFGSFYDRVENPQIELFPFYREYQKIVGDFEKKTKSFVKNLGDGFLAVKELSDNKKDHVKFLEELWNHMLIIDYHIKKKSTPRPDGIRSRISSGYVWEIYDGDRLDYLGSRIHLTEQMIHIERSIQLIMHESAKELYKDKDLKKTGLTLAKVNLSDDILDSIRPEYQKEMRSLWIVKPRT